MHTPKGAIPHTGAYQEISRPRRLVFTWNSPYAGQHGSLVTVDFNARGRAATEIVITHELNKGPADHLLLVREHAKSRIVNVDDGALRIDRYDRVIAGVEQ